MSRLRDIKRRARADIHNELGVGALYYATSTATPVSCTVRVWTKRDPNMVGELPGFQGAAVAAEPEDRIRIDLSQFPPSSLPRRLGIVSVEPGEAYRLDHLYPVDLGYQTAKVIRLDADEASRYAAPE